MEEPGNEKKLVGILHRKGSYGINSRENLRACQSRRMTRHSLPGDQSLHRYLFQEHVLNFSLVITTLASVALFAFIIWARHDKVGMLRSYLGDKIERVKEDSVYIHKNVTVKGRRVYKPPLLDHPSTSEEEDDLDMGSWVRVITDLLLTIVLLMWATSIAGVLCIFEKNRVFVIAFIVSNLVNILTELLIAGILLGGQTKLHDGIEKQMIHVLKLKYDPDKDTINTRVLNSIMVVGKCCGIHGPEDFVEHRYKTDTVTGKTIVKTIQFPPACCKIKTWWNFDEVFPTLLKCQTEGLSDTNLMYHGKGCFEVWINKFVDSTSMYIIAATTALCGLQLLQACIGGIILKWTTFVTRLDHENTSKLTVSDSNSQQWVSGLRTTTVSELLMAQGHCLKK